MRKDQEFFVALGGNIPSHIGPPIQTLKGAIERLSADGIETAAVSRFYCTACFPAGAGPDFVNAAARVRFAGTPADLLGRLHGLEAQLGRERLQRWGQRTLDLDLVAAGERVLPDRQIYAFWRNLPPEQQAATAPRDLILPHPRLQDRAFVLVPLADIAPDWRHPVLGRTVSEMLADLPEAQKRDVQPL